MNPIALAERLLQLIPVLFGISAIVFSMMALTPGDPVDVMLGDSLAASCASSATRSRASSGPASTIAARSPT